MGESLLQLRGVEKAFGATRALQGVTLDLNAGEVTALVGENGAGKSTLMNIISGALMPDAGEIRLDGKPIHFRSAAEGRAAGLALIHQELSLFPHLTVAENIIMGTESAHMGWLQPGRDRARVDQVLQRFSHPAITLDRKVGDLPVAAQQVVEICRALVGQTRVLLMDEPTSSLERRDVDRLFALVDNLRKDGMAVVYISHFLEEVRAISDRVVVLRDGRDVGGGETKSLEDRQIVSLMVGRSVDELYPPRGQGTVGDVLLQVRDLHTTTGVAGANLTLRRGEILGIAGIVGSGRTELLRAIAGLDATLSGHTTLGGQILGADGFQPAQRIARGIGYLSEDRKREGLALTMSIADNTTLSRWKEIARMGWLSLSAQLRAADRQIADLSVRAQSAAQPVGTLSGGNQQKVALGRLFHQQADLFLLDEPTRGVDIGSKTHIYRAIRQAADAGKAVLVVSSYLPELFGLCDQLAVMCRGALSPVRAVNEWTPQSVMAFATGAGAEAAA